MKAAATQVGRGRAKRLRRSAVPEQCAGKGAPFKDEDAALLVEELEEIKAMTGGRASERDIDEYAHTHPESTFHRLLEMDPDKALRKYRIIQIKNIVRYLKYRIIGGGVVYEPRIYARVHATEADGIPGPPGPTYVHRTEVFENKRWRQQLLDRALREIQAWQARYEIEMKWASEEFRFMYDAIRTFESMLEKKRPKQETVQ